jgi:hypothetical protein
MANRQQTYDAIRRLVASLDDPFTRFLEPERLTALRRGTKGGGGGAGWTAGPWHTWGGRQRWHPGAPGACIPVVAPRAP